MGSLFVWQTVALLGSRVAVLWAFVLLDAATSAHPHVIAFAETAGLTNAVAVAGVRAGTNFATVAHPCLVALAFTGRCTGAMVVAVVQTGF